MNEYISFDSKDLNRSLSLVTICGALRVVIQILSQIAKEISSIKNDQNLDLQILADIRILKLRPGLLQNLVLALVKKYLTPTIHNCITCRHHVQCVQFCYYSDVGR